MSRRSKETSSSEAGAGPELLTINGWRIGFHAQLLLQIERLIAAVEKERRGGRERPVPSQPALILASLRKLIFDDIPADPARSIYRQGHTLGGARKHWFRAKFGNGRYRLFFRYSSRARVLVFAWVNDEETLRTYGSSTDAYATFSAMLDDGNPPDDWDTLLSSCADEQTIQRFRRILAIMQGERSG